jgi:hypothetical protein
MKNVKEVPMDRQLVKKNFHTILFIILLIAISLFLGMLPTLSFGQDAFMTASPPPMPTPTPTPTPEITASFLPEVQPTSGSTPSGSPASIELSSATNPVRPANPTPNPITNLSDSSSILPTPSLTPIVSSPTSPLNSPQRPHKTPKPMNVQGSAKLSSGKSASLAQKSSSKSSSQLSNRFENLRSVVDPNHPFARYFDLPKEPQSIIKGQPYTVAQLLDGAKTSVSRRQLLQTYWELTGLLVEYNIRCEAERLSGSVPNTQQNVATVLLQQQRRSTEIEFIKKQWQLSGYLRYFKGISLSEKELPIPCDYPLYKRYETFADKIAGTARSQYLGHLIPVQEQLVDARHRGCITIFEMLQNIPSDSRQLIDVLNQRTTAFLELAEAVIDYNKMIAEYVSETIPSEISGFRLVGALIELPKTPETLKLNETTQINSQTKRQHSDLLSEL